MWSDWKEKKHLMYNIPKRLLWDVDIQRFDFQKGRALVELNLILTLFYLTKRP